jgi:hypothetical protein
MLRCSRFELQDKEEAFVIVLTFFSEAQTYPQNVDQYLNESELRQTVGTSETGKNVLHGEKIVYRRKPTIGRRMHAQNSQPTVPPVPLFH